MTDKVAPALATRLLATHEGGCDAYHDQEGICCFCGEPGPGQHVDDAVSATYFSDDDHVADPQSDHVCAACACIMDQRTYKQGHWIAHADGVETPSTGDLLDAFRRLRAGAFAPPLAIHVTSSPIRSSHAYLWTPVNETALPLTVAYDREHVRIADWDRFDELVAAVEDFRLSGFTFDEIRSGVPRVRNLQSIGRGAYLARDDVIDPHRRTARLELALTLSRSADDQARTDLTDHTPLTHGN